MTFRTPEFESFVAPARRKAAFWRLILGLFFFAVIYFAWLALLFAGIGILRGEAALVEWMTRVQMAADPVATLILLVTFGGVVIALWPIVRLIHRRSFGSLFGPRDRTLRDFRRATLVTLAGMLVSLGLFAAGTDLVPNLPLGSWLLFLPLALLGLLLQTGAEELLFRGYLQQQLAARFSSALIWMLLPSVLFGFAHFDPTTFGPSSWYFVAATGLFGLLAADLTWRTGSIGAAWGMHFANNCFALLGIAVQGTLPGLALFVVEIPLTDTAEIGPLILQDMVLTLLIYGAVRWAVRR